MDLILPSGTLLYRVTRVAADWQEVISGMGAYHSLGGRYNGPQQRTVYAAQDPLVAITEQAHYEAGAWQDRIDDIAGSAANGLASEHLLWLLELTAPLHVIDVDHPQAFATFHHSPLILRNPGRKKYTLTRQLADQVRVHPNPVNPTAMGLHAPSARTPSFAGYSPTQEALFVTDPVHHLIPARRVRRWQLTIEFLDGNNQGPVNPHSVIVSWGRPRFEVRGARTAIPAFAGRPHSQTFHIRTWYPFDVAFA